MVDLKNEKIQLNALENLVKQKRFSDALTIASKLNHDFPNSFQIKLLYAGILKELNKLEEAEEGFKELNRLFPNNIKLLLEMGNLAVKRSKFDEALEYFNKILFLDPFNSEAKNSIEKIDAMRKKGIGGGDKETDIITYQRETLDNADTLPEFDSKASLEQKKIKEKLFAPPPPLKLTPEDQVEPPKPQPRPQPQAQVSPSLLSPPPPQPSPVPGAVDDKKGGKIGERERKKEEDGGTEFVTESAALLYLKQELFDDALAIYEKLYASRKEEKFLLKIKEIKRGKELKRRRIIQKKIEVLTEYLKVIKERQYQHSKGDQIV